MVSSCFFSGCHGDCVCQLFTVQMTCTSQYRSLSNSGAHVISFLQGLRAFAGDERHDGCWRSGIGGIRQVAQFLHPAGLCDGLGPLPRVCPS
jgi:hypothetical protein